MQNGHCVPASTGIRIFMFTVQKKEEKMVRALLSLVEEILEE